MSRFFLCIIAGWLGWSLAGPLGAIIGYFLANLLAERFALGLGFSQRGKINDHFFPTLFRAMGMLAKADGRVNEAEIATAENLFRALGLKGETRKLAIEHYREGVSLELDLEKDVRAFAAVCGHRPQLFETFLELLVTSAMSDGVMHDNEERLLVDIGMWLNLPTAKIRHVIDRAQAQERFSATGRKHSPEEALLEAYHVLGVESSATDVQVKKAYRKLMSEHHPDKLMSKGLPRDLLAAATQKAQEIQSAYDHVKQNRGMV